MEKMTREQLIEAYKNGRRDFIGIDLSNVSIRGLYYE